MTIYDWLNIGGFIVLAIMYIHGVPEWFGYRIKWFPPGIKRTYVRWDAKDVAITGMFTALAVVLHMSLAAIPSVPGLPAWNLGWLTTDAFWCVMGILYGAPGALAMSLTGVITDALVGALAAWSINGFIRGTIIPIYFLRVFGNDPDKIFADRWWWAKWIGVVILWIYLLNNWGACAIASVFMYLPAPIVYAATYLIPLGFLPDLLGGLILGPIFLKGFAELSKRYGLLAKDRHVPRT